MTTRWSEVAAVVADGTGIGAGSTVSIFATAHEAVPAVDAFVREVYRRGGLPQVLLTDESFDRHALDHADDATVATPGPLEMAAMEWSDVHVSFRAMVPPSDQAPDPDRLALQRQAKGKVSTARWQHTRWALVRVPTDGWARMIGVDFADLEREVIDGCLGDWAAHTERISGLCETLAGSDVCRITTEDTDLVLPVAGRTWVPFAGANNFPDGEIATAPLEDRVSGHITFPGTFWFAGTAITDLRLEFTDGLVSDIRAAEGERFTRMMLSSDEGAGRVGELGIGTNAGMRTMTGDLLVDEKILGTVHIALGRAYPECGGVNDSSVHWDIVKDLRSGGEVTVGEHVLIEQGRPTGLLTG